MAGLPRGRPDHRDGGLKGKRQRGSSANRTTTVSGHYCNGPLTNIITRSYMGQWAWESRHRTAMPGQYDWTSLQSSRDSHDVNQPFWDQLDRWARNMNFWANNYGTTGATGITWFGEVGIINCSRSSASHNRGRGYDLCRVSFNPYYCDCNRSYTVNQLHKRRYVSVDQETVGTQARGAMLGHPVVEELFEFGV